MLLLICSTSCLFARTDVSTVHYSVGRKKMRTPCFLLLSWRPPSHPKCWMCFIETVERERKRQTNLLYTRPVCLGGPSTLLPIELASFDKLKETGKYTVVHWTKFIYFSNWNQNFRQSSVKGIKTNSFYYLFSQRWQSQVSFRNWSSSNWVWQCVFDKKYNYARTHEDLLLEILG